MIQLQILSKVINTQDNSIIENNVLTSDYFVGYTDEYEFIQKHIKDYGNVPDSATFLAKFPNFELVEVTESDKYLVDIIKEEHLYTQLVPIIQKSAELSNKDSNSAVDFLMSNIKSLQTTYNLSGTDIIAESAQRFEEFVERKNNPNNAFFTCGFEELDELTHGIQRGEELYVIFARTNQGKSWILEKMCVHVWQLGFNIGYVSPEMGANSVGFRFDTLLNNFSNKGLMWGNDSVLTDEYKLYLQTLTTHDNKFIVATPSDFDRKITVTKLRNFVKQNKLDLLAIDGIKYLTDERYKRGDNTTTSLTNISEDLMALSVELGIPVLVVVQSNRTGVAEDGKDDTPELESIRDSDGIAHNASKVISLRQIKDMNVLDIGIKKQRFGPVGGKLKYNWDIDTGRFTYIPSYDDASRNKTEAIATVRKKYNDVSDVF